MIALFNKKTDYAFSGHFYLKSVVFSRMVKKTNRSNYFVMLPIANYVGSILLLVTLHIQCFSPDIIPYEKMPIFSKAYKYFAYENPTFIRNAYSVLVGIHFVEAIVCIIVAITKGITSVLALFKWFIQTFINGWFSLKIILFKVKKPKYL